LLNGRYKSELSATLSTWRKREPYGDKTHFQVGGTENLMWIRARQLLPGGFVFPLFNTDETLTFLGVRATTEHETKIFTIEVHASNDRSKVIHCGSLKKGKLNKNNCMS
jgi:hypothetical protein